MTGDPGLGSQLSGHSGSRRACTRVGNFRQKNYSAGNGIDRTISLFRRNFSCSEEQKTLGIPFRNIPQRRKMLGILNHGTKMERNSRNSVLNHSGEKEPTRNSIPWNKNRSKLSEFRSEACLDENALSILFARPGYFVKAIFSCHSVPF
jgi:hypothetical protein